MPEPTALDVPPIPPVYGGLDAGLRPETRAQVQAALSRGMDPVEVLGHVARALDAVRELYDRSVPTGGPKPACLDGCHYCCHMRVEVTAPEVFCLVRHLRKHANPHLLLRVRETAQRLVGLNSRGHHLAQVSCPLLSDTNSCGVYALRPLSCRRAHCTDSSLCAYVHENPDTEQLLPDIPELAFHLSAPMVGYFEGMQLAGLPPHQYELCAALSIALDTPKVEQQWWAGEDLLTPAQTRTAQEIQAILSRQPEDSGTPTTNG